MTSETKAFMVACIPAYNEESSIGGVVVRAKGYVDRVLVCDDGSEGSVWCDCLG